MGKNSAAGQTLLEKITEGYAAGWPADRRVRANDFVTIRPKHVMTHDNTGAVIPKFVSMFDGRPPKVFDPSQPVLAIDHDIQNTTPENLGKYAKIEAFARANGLAFFPPGTGIAHQIMAEECFALPGTFVVGSDSHSNLYGALACAGTPVVRTDAAAIWATGRTWWQVPESVRVTLTGALQPGVVGKDVIIALCGLFKDDDVLNASVEFAGPGVAGLSMDQRMTIANMTTEWGALLGIFPYDAVTRRYLLSRARRFAERGDAAPRMTPALLERMEPGFPAADEDAFYAREATLDLGSVVPHVAGPNEVKVITPLPEIERRKVAVQKAYLLSCVNSRLEDIAAAARVVKGRKIAPTVKMYLAAASADVERQARAQGFWDDLVTAGAIPLPSGCGPCIGLGTGVLEPGEVAISATNRNFKGRMGARDSQAYLASPEVVAASALAGYIASPSPYASTKLVGEIRSVPAPAAAPGAVEILPGFPREIRGELLFCDKDNLNTDGIFGKDFTYVDNMPPAVMGTKAMLNYDPKFQEIARDGDILVAGWNFGSGSSREQAATALKYRGLRMIVAGSYSQTYKRNAFNNGYVVIECPPLVTLLRARFAALKQPTVRTSLAARVDFSASRIEADGKTFPFSPLGDVAQRLVVAGGFESLLRQEIRERT
ncbi:MAG: homoaconitase [Acidobacteria bacterium]|nr:homoaconitase [Acidobacteriota bacterium]